MTQNHVKRGQHQSDMSLSNLIPLLILGGSARWKISSIYWIFLVADDDILYEAVVRFRLLERERDCQFEILIVGIFMIYVISIEI